jgi:hypothetical protein
MATGSPKDKHMMAKGINTVCMEVFVLMSEMRRATHLDSKNFGGNYYTQVMHITLNIGRWRVSTSMLVSFILLP